MSTRAGNSNDSTRISLNMTQGTYPHALPSLPGLKKLPPSFSVKSLVWVPRTLKLAQKGNLTPWITFKPNTPQRHGLMSTQMALQRKLYDVGGPESTFSIQEAEKTCSALQPVSTLQTTEPKQKP